MFKNVRKYHLFFYRSCKLLIGIYMIKMRMEEYNIDKAIWLKSYSKAIACLIRLSGNNY